MQERKRDETQVIEECCRAITQAAQAFDLPFIRYESGSIETLIHVVDYNPGMTIIPEMHAMGLGEEQQGNLRQFKNCTAVREVSLVVGKDYVRRTMLNRIMEIVRSSVPKSMQNPELKAFVVDL